MFRGADTGECYHTSPLRGNRVRCMHERVTAAARDTKGVDDSSREARAVHHWRVRPIRRSALQSVRRIDRTFGAPSHAHGPSPSVESSNADGPAKLAARWCILQVPVRPSVEPWRSRRLQLHE